MGERGRTTSASTNVLSAAGGTWLGASKRVSAEDDCRVTYGAALNLWRGNGLQARSGSDAVRPPYDGPPCVR